MILAYDGEGVGFWVCLAVPQLDPSLSRPGIDSLGWDRRFLVETSLFIVQKLPEPME